MRLARTILVSGLVLLAPPGFAATEQAEPYDLLFKLGTLDDVARDRTLIYSRTVENALVPETEARDTGDIQLSFAEDETDDTEEAVLTFHQDEKHRMLGEFPASVGNPLILYFVETVSRDMAESAGGSPFYIRNRVKEALVSPATIETGEETTVTMRPFEGDPNADRMKGFEDLTLTVTMSDDVPGWYSRLEATVPGADGPIYSSTLTYEGDK